MQVIRHSLTVGEWRSSLGEEREPESESSWWQVMTTRETATRVTVTRACMSGCLAALLLPLFSMRGCPSPPPLDVTRGMRATREV